ncbi:MAG: tRNA (adenosine(37)-N6)-threonylcarbamoyltransferase complex ATPase subunit type 1 TsaE [Thiohalomonadales bacterium]
MLARARIVSATTLKRPIKKMCEFIVPDEEQMAKLAAALATGIHSQCVIYLQGDLGAGKTCFARGLIRSKGYRGAVKSPTYTVVEQYTLAQQTIIHFDLYRLADAEELEYLGIRDYSHAEAILLIEWPELGKGFLPQADLTVKIDYKESARNVQIDSASARGTEILENNGVFCALKPFLVQNNSIDP